MKATVDRIEGRMAVLVTQEDNPVTFNIPTALLGEVSEGDIVNISIRRDMESTKASRLRVSSQIEKLKQKSKK